jgi:CRISPR system Cascade subunit CasC
MRRYFAEHLELDKSKLSDRTKLVFDLVAKEIRQMAPGTSEEDAMQMAINALELVKIKQSTKESKADKAVLDALFFISTQQVKNVAAAAISGADGKTVKAAITQGNGIDLALFGRMVAADPELNSDASAQVAHAISTHRVENEYDFYTAVDDIAKDIQDHAGAGMMGTVEYNSATLYRYATVAAHELYGLLSSDQSNLEKAIEAFVSAFVHSIPTGRQNTFAAHTIPDAVLVALRTDRPLNLVGAFEDPVKGSGIVSSSAAVFEKYTQNAYDNFCAKPDLSFVVGQYLESLGDRLPLCDLVERIGNDVAERLCI